MWEIYFRRDCCLVQKESCSVQMESCFRTFAGPAGQLDRRCKGCMVGIHRDFGLEHQKHQQNSAGTVHKADCELDVHD